jgi:acyl-CoA reductase-like NAD-dependent aldehyde dehydrogenase
MTNNQLLIKLANIFENHSNEVAKNNTLDTATSYHTNLENLQRGISTLRKYASIQYNGKVPNGVALYSCYNDPSYALLGMTLAQTILTVGNKKEILIGFPSILKNYSAVFKDLLSSDKLFSNIRFTTGIKDFFSSALNSDIDTAIVFGDESMEPYFNKWQEKKRSLIYFGPGNNASIILKSATNIRYAVHKTLETAFILSGQAAVCINRCYIDNSFSKNEIEPIFLQELQKFSFGFNSFENYVTPIKIKFLTDIVQKRISTSIQNGATTTNYSVKTDNDKVLISPTLVWEKNINSSLMNEFHFAPVLPISFINKEDIAKQVNSTSYGIYSTVWSNDKDFKLLRNDLYKKNIMVPHNKSILEIISPKSGYRGLWGGYDKSGYYFSKNTNWEKRYGRIDLPTLINNY